MAAERSFNLVDCAEQSDAAMDDAKKQQPLQRAPKRRVLRYGLRTLAVAIGCLCAWLAYQTHLARQQRAAVAAIKLSHGSVDYDFQEIELGYDMEAPHPAPRWLGDLVGPEYFQEVGSVSLSVAKVTSADLMPLAHLPKLKHLAIADIALMYDGGPYKRSEYLIGSMTSRRERFEPLQLAPLQNLASLESVNFNAAHITDSQLVYVADLPRLKELILNFTAVTDTGLRYLSCNRSLEHLSLEGTSVTDQGLRCLEEIPNLKMLGLGATLITDKGLESLRRMPALREVYINYTDLTPHAVERLRKQRPDFTTLAFTQVPKSFFDTRENLWSPRFADQRKTAGSDHKEMMEAFSKLGRPDAASSAAKPSP